MKQAILLQTYAAQIGGGHAALHREMEWRGADSGDMASPPEPKAAPYETPSYSRPDSFSSHDISVGADEWQLPGTLTVPKGKGPWPAVVLVHGSRPNDRNESVGGVRVFRDLAEGLATRGIAVLRYDKRTKVRP